MECVSQESRKMECVSQESQRMYSKQTQKWPKNSHYETNN